MSSMLVYCQTLLKSIPATTNLAEELFKKKSELVVNLPDTAEPLMEVMKEQKDLLTKIERHIQFFIKWDQITNLKLPRKVKVALQKSAEFASEYNTAIEVMIDILEKKDTKEFKNFLLLEERIFKKINEIFENPWRDESSIFANMYNLAVKSVARLASPISKLLQTLSLVIMFPFKNEILENYPVVLQPKQGPILSPKIKTEELAQDLQLRGWQIKTVKGTNPDSPLIILKQDVHNSPEYEWNFLCYMLKKYRINLVALEGWAGEEQDWQRGRTVLNAEIDLIKRLLPNTAFHKIGLEDAYLQDGTLEIMYLKISKYDSHSILDSSKLANLMSSEGISMSKIEQDCGTLLEKSKEEISNIFNEIGVNRRSQLWAEKIAGLKFNSIIAVIGRGHTETFLEHIKQQGDFNIVIVSPQPG